MSSLDFLARAARQYDSGFITAAEFVDKLSDYFAGCPDLDTRDAATVAAIIPNSARALLIAQTRRALSPDYMRRPFHGVFRTEEQAREATIRETKREQAWAAVLKPLLESTQS